MKLKKLTAKAEKEVKEWNDAYKVGQKISVKKDNGEIVTTVTYAPASIIGSTAVGWFKGIGGCYDLDRATPVED